MFVTQAAKKQSTNKRFLLLLNILNKLKHKTGLVIILHWGYWQ